MFLSKRKKRTVSEGKALVEEFLRSGLKSVHFCREKKICFHVLQYWRCKLENETHLSKPSSTSFLPVQLIPSTPLVVQAQSNIKVHLGRGLIVEICSGFDKGTLKGVLEVCQSCG